MKIAKCKLCSKAFKGSDNKKFCTAKHRTLFYSWQKRKIVTINKRRYIHIGKQVLKEKQALGIFLKQNKIRKSEEKTKWHLKK